MALSTDKIALTALLALTAPRAAATGMWRTDPMIVWVNSSYTDEVIGSFSNPNGADVLVIDKATGTAELRPFHNLLSGTATAFSFPDIGTRAYRSGRLAPNNSDWIADVVRPSDGLGIQVAFGNDCVLRTYSISYPPRTNEAAAFLHLLQRTADVLVLPYRWDAQGLARVIAVDFDPSLAATTQSWAFGADLFMDQMTATPTFEAAPIRLSSLAQAYGIDDVAALGQGGVVLFLQAASSPPSELSAIQLASPIAVGGEHWGLTTRPPWLPATIPNRGDALGVAAVDVNLDHNLDLVFPQTILQAGPDGTPLQGSLVWVEGTGVPADFADWTRTPWHDLGTQLGLSKPLIVRQIEVNGVPAVAVWDGALQQVIVAWPDYGVGMLRTWRAPAPGRLATDIRQVDVVGSAAKDLVITMENPPLPDTVLVYPDDGLPWPALSWAAGSPGTPARGVPHSMEVVLDPSGPATVTVDWIEGAPTTAPVAQGVGLVQHVFPAICTMPPPDLVVTVRAIDGTGVFTDLHATLPVATLQPSIALEDARSPGLLRLEPEETTAVFEGVAATGCGAATWGGAWPALATIADTSGDTWMRREVTLPEVVYPELLSDPSLAVSLATTDPGAAQPVVTLPIEIDGSELVDVTHASDRSALAEGDIAVLRTHLRSRIHYALPRIRVVDVLQGLVPAGPPSVSGAGIVSSASDGTDLVLDALPAAPAEVVIELPVRSAGGQGASAVEAWSEGGWRLTPPAPADMSAELPGCGCGGGGGGSALAVLGLVLLARRRRETRLT